METTQLQQRLAELQQEQRETQAAITSFNDNIAACQAAIRSAQQRYDLQGDDAAADEIKEQRSLITVHEERRRRAQEQLSEYPARIEAVRTEIASNGHREELRRLVELRQAEVQAFNQAEQTMLSAIEDWQSFNAAREQRRQVARKCEDFARQNSLPIPPSGNFNPPVPDGLWFNRPNTIEYVQAEFAKSRRGIPTA